MIKNIVLALPVACLPVLVNGALAAPLPANGTFVYSNACQFEGGDLEGYRVTLTRGPIGFTAVVEFNDDGADGRATAGDVAFNSATGDLRFSFQGGDGDQYAFDGAVTAEKLAGAFNAKLAGEASFSRGRTQILPLIANVPKTPPSCHF